MPARTHEWTAAQIAAVRAAWDGNKSIAEIAEMVGVSRATLRHQARRMTLPDRRHMQAIRGTFGAEKLRSARAAAAANTASRRCLGCRSAFMPAHRHNFMCHSCARGAVGVAL